MSEYPPDSTDDLDAQPVNLSGPAGLTNLATFCRAVIEHSAIPIAIIGGADHTLQCASPGFARLFNREAAEVCGQPLRGVLASIQTLELIDSLDHAYKTGETIAFRQDLHTHPHHGPIAWTYAICPILDIAGRPSELFLEVQDTTAQQLAAQVAQEIQTINEQLILTRLHEQAVAEQLQDQLTFIQALTQSLSEGVYALDRAGQVSYVNFSAEQMLGWAAADLLGRNAQLVIPVQFRADSAEAEEPTPFAEVMRSGNTYRHDNALLTHRHGETLTVSYTLAPILSAGAIIGAVAVMHDVSELRRLQQIREEYLTLISHDLRSPLTAILGMAQLLDRRLRKLDLTREIRQVETIMDSGRRMDEMIQDLLDRSALEAGIVLTERSTIDLVQVLGQMIEQLPTETDRSRIQIEAVERLLIVGDQDQIERMLVNLLSNALKYSPPECIVEVRLSKADQQALVTVRDYGVGIHQEDIALLFSKHYRARTAGDVKGTGLGLYSSQLIVAAHHGRLWVESLVGIGSTFSVSLPMKMPDL